jgi:two-component system OmpR family sensor kinase
MKNISILTFIRILFIFVFLAIFVAFGLFIRMDIKKYKLQQQDRYELIANGFLSGFDYLSSDEQWTLLYEKFEVRPVEEDELKLEILNDAKTIFKKESNGTRIRIFSLYLNNYIYVQQGRFNLMLKDVKKRSYSASIAIALFLMICIILIVFYIMLIKKLRPLKKLHKAIMEFGQGDLNVSQLSTTKDEIGQISRSFNDAITNINTLINSRNLFMRNMMHELKTPVAKGMILANMIETNNQQDKQLLINTLEQMNQLISTLANIEKISMINQTIIKNKTNFNDILDDIKKQLYLHKDEMVEQNCSIDIIVNVELFTIVVKNLIDNALKYGKSIPIYLKCEEDKIIVSSKGDKLQQPLEYYIQPFSQEKKNSSGFGLGLYIVNEILKLHQFKLEYNYQDGINSFIIKL